jgi:hypothetical protein
MSTRNPDYRRLKHERTYTAHELAIRLGCHPNTVSNWRKGGLAPVDDTRPRLFKGEHVIAFLKRRRQNARQPCPPGTIYCVACRGPRPPAGGMVDYVPVKPDRGNLCGICPGCERLITRRVRRADLPIVAAGLDLSCAGVTVP